MASGTPHPYVAVGLACDPGGAREKPRGEFTSVERLANEGVPSHSTGDHPLPQKGFDRGRIAP
jgi:hypothetical protein